MTTSFLRTISIRCIAIGVALSVTMATAVAEANPSGAEVANGTATITQRGGQLNVRASDGAIINWREFSIGAGESTRFVQPGASARVLNRVVGVNPSRIDGQLLANGRVFLINRNGVVFGAGSVVDTAGLVASTLNITDNDFTQEAYRFSGEGAGQLVNRGYIRTSGAGDVVLIAPTIENHGVIETKNGDLLLAAGESVVLESLDVEHVSFEVSATGGDVLNLGKLLTDDGAIGLFARNLSVSGEVHANRIKRDQSGRIQLVAANSNNVTGLVLADGHDAEIIVDGNHTTVGSTAAISTGGAGRLIVYGDQHLTVQGELSAENGFVETSTGGALDIARAPRIGANGQWLIDPTDINIVETGGSLNPGSITGDVAEVGVDVITDGLSQGGEVIVSTVGTSGTGNGDINVLAKINHGGSGQLTLEATNDINVRRAINTGDVAVKLDAGGDVDISADISGRSLTVNADSMGLNNATVATSASVSINTSAVTLHNGQINSTQSININATGPVIVSQGSVMSAVSGIDVNAGDFLATEGTQLNSDTDILITADNAIRLETTDESDVLLQADNNIMLDSPTIALVVPSEFDGQPIRASVVEIIKGRVDCTDCDPHALVEGRLIGIPEIVDGPEDPVDEEEEPNARLDDEDGDDAEIIDTSEPRPAPRTPATANGDRLGEEIDDPDSTRPSADGDTQLSNQDLVSEDVETPEDTSSTVVATIDPDASAPAQTTSKPAVKAISPTVDDEVATAGPETDTQTAIDDAVDTPDVNDTDETQVASISDEPDNESSETDVAADPSSTDRQDDADDNTVASDTENVDAANASDGDESQAVEDESSEESPVNDGDEVAEESHDESTTVTEEQTVAAAKKPLQCS